jgi:hypothetical protein
LSVRPVAFALAFALGLGLRCTPAVSPPPAPPTPTPAIAEDAPAPLAAPAEPPAEPPPPPRAPRPPFPPPSFPPPVERTARAGDGAWTPLVEAGAGEPALLYRSSIHPDPIKPHVHVALVAIDLDRVLVHLVAGTREPLSTAVPPERRPGLVPAADRSDLLAVMNGGFRAHHGAWGMKIGGDVFLPPQDDGCTVALGADGGIVIRTHTELAGALGGVVAYRQTPPCLVEQGVINPALLGGEKPRRWGLSETGAVDIRRSALGIADGGRTLIYGLGEWITPRALAESMRAAGAASVAELDVNWSFTRFLLYGPGASPGSPPEVTSTLVPKIKHAPGEYVQKASERDFLYLSRRR